MERELDVAANNVANAATDGFRAERVTFEQFLARGRTADDETRFVIDRASWSDAAPGPIAITGNPLDIAIDGPGWLSYRMPDGGAALGRDGRLVVDAEGTLRTTGGAAILDDGGAPVVLPRDAGTPAIARDGTVSGADGAVLARIGLRSAPDVDGLARGAGGMFLLPEGALDALADAPEAGLTQGAIEGSNVVPVMEMTRLIEIQRAYERATTMMRTHDDLARDAVRRLSSGR